MWKYKLMREKETGGLRFIAIVSYWPRWGKQPGRQTEIEGGAKERLWGKWKGGKRDRLNIFTVHQ